MWCCLVFIKPNTYFVTESIVKPFPRRVVTWSLPTGTRYPKEMIRRNHCIIMYSIQFNVSCEKPTFSETHGVDDRQISHCIVWLRLWIRSNFSQPKYFSCVFLGRSRPLLCWFNTQQFSSSLYGYNAQLTGDIHQQHWMVWPGVLNLVRCLRRDRFLYIVCFCLFPRHMYEWSFDGELSKQARFLMLCCSHIWFRRHELWYFLGFCHR